MTYGSLPAASEESAPLKKGRFTAKRAVLAAVFCVAVLGGAFVSLGQAPANSVVNADIYDCKGVSFDDKTGQNNCKERDIDDIKFANPQLQGVHFLSGDEPCLEAGSNRHSKKYKFVDGSMSGFLYACQNKDQGQDLCGQGVGKCDTEDTDGNTHGFCIVDLVKRKNDPDYTHECICDVGYHTETCSDENECVEKEDNMCNAEARCRNTEGSYECEPCSTGYTTKHGGRDTTTESKDGCIDTDFCKTAKGEDQDCGNSISPHCEDAKAPSTEHTCVCRDGWEHGVDGKCNLDINECERGSQPDEDGYACPLNSDCTNTEGSFSCTCKKNWYKNEDWDTPGKDKECEETNKCASTNGHEKCHNGGTCKTLDCGVDENIISSAYSDADFKFQTDLYGVSKWDRTKWKNFWDRTTWTGTDYGSRKDAECFKCKCLEGFEGDACGRDVNECSDGKTKCPAHSNCVNTHGSYSCICELGYGKTEDGQKCEDLDDCQSHPCANGGSCVDEGPLAFSCTCTVGWSGTTCSRDWNECLLGIHVCNDEATCINTPGSFDCECDPGWTGTGLTNQNEVVGGAVASKLTEGCVDVNDCESNPCKNGGTCDNKLRGEFLCDCPAGWIDSTCDVNLNECNPFDFAKTDLRCSPNARCIDTLPVEGEYGYKCECNRGFKDKNEDDEAGIVCMDVNDCADVDCSKHGDCIDKGADLYTCTCHAGWHGQDCDLDINECNTGDNECARNADCKNNDGGYDCTCKTGFKPNPTAKLNCMDVDDCTKNSKPCSNNGACKDTGRDSFVCICYDGWTDARCDHDVNECAGPDDVCEPENSNSFLSGKPKEEKTQDGGKSTYCRNSNGGHTCVCLPGFERGDDNKCEDIDDCAGAGTTCHNHGTCNNLFGPKRQCDCNEGYGGLCDDNHDCKEDCDECKEKTDDCDDNAECEPNDSTATNPAWYTCTCRTGFYGIGTECKPCKDLCSTGYDEEVACGAAALDLGTTDRVCKNRNECDLGTHKCSINADCVDTIGFYTCTCKDGYWGDGFKEAITDPEDRTGSKCTLCTECSAGYHEKSPCTSTSDRKCQRNLPNGDYIIESEAGADGAEQCLKLVGGDWFPSLINYGNDNKCGIESETSYQTTVPIKNQELVWKLKALNTNSEKYDAELYTISHQNEDEETKCLRFGGTSGSDVYPTLVDKDQSCLDYDDISSCPWTFLSTDSSCRVEDPEDDCSFCGFKNKENWAGMPVWKKKFEFLKDGSAVFKITPIKISENKYIIRTAKKQDSSQPGCYLKSTVDSSCYAKCLAFEEQGAATHPSRYNWGNGDTFCGVGDWEGQGKDVALLGNKQAVFIFTKLQ